MGATVTTGKKVSAFQRTDGTTIFVMFERTYEKNCYPHTDHWGCRGIGTYDQAMQYVFKGACSCESGMLQLRSGSTKPEHYIQRWREEFAKPTRMDDVEITLTLGGDSIYSTIPTSQVEFALAALETAGRQDIADQLKVGPVTISLHRDIDVVLALYGVDTPIPAWKVIREYHCGSVPRHDLAPGARTANVVPPAVHVHKLDEKDLIMGIEGQPLAFVGWLYQAVQNYMMDVVYELELQCTGSSKRLIGAFKEQCANAPTLPERTTITITPEATEHWYYKKEAKRLAVALGFCDSADSAPASYQVTLGQVRAAEETYALTHLDTPQLQWSIPQTPPGSADCASAHAAPTQQQALF